MQKVYPDSVIVDDEDNPIGHMQLPEAIKQNKNLRVGRVIIVNSKGDMLLQQRGRNIAAPLLWNDAASGHVDEGDSYLETAVKELLEETGLTVDPNDLEQIDYFYIREGRLGSDTGRFHTVYKYVYDGEVEVQDEEVESFRWSTIEDLDTEMREHPERFTGGFMHLAQNYIKKISNI